MKKMLLSIIVILLFVSKTSFAFDTRPQLGATISTHTLQIPEISGMASLGFHSDFFDITTGYATYSNNASEKTDLAITSAYAGVKKDIGPQTYLTCGLKYSKVSGKYKGTLINDWNDSSITIGLQQQLTSNLLLEFKYSAISQIIKKLDGPEEKSIVFGGNTTISMTYLIDGITL